MSSRKFMDRKAKLSEPLTLMSQEDDVLRRTDFNDLSEELASKKKKNEVRLLTDSNPDFCGLN